jgi:YebC/PmpR family DNA-binding regulatory protein
MSGHSKWHNIQNKKGKADAKRGKIFTKIGREIAVSCKEGGANPDTNSKLRDAIAKAKANNMPLDTITTAVKKGAGELGDVVFEEITYEGYGPGGTAIIVESLTDNKNRTAGNVRHTFDKYNGNMGAAGCVSYMFDRKGVIIVEREGAMDEDELMMIALDLGADDFSSEDEDVYEIITSPDSFSTVREELEKQGVILASAEISMVPQNIVDLDVNKAPTFTKLIDMLEDDDDVQNVWHNAEFPEGYEG